MEMGCPLGVILAAQHSAPGVSAVGAVRSHMDSANFD